MGDDRYTSAFGRVCTVDCVLTPQSSPKVNGKAQPNVKAQTNAKTRAAVVVASLVIASLGLTGCNDDKSSASATSTTTTAPSETTTSAPQAPTTSATGASSGGGNGVTTASVAPSNVKAHLTAIRLDRYEQRDRLVFEFDGTVPPGYAINYKPDGAPTMEGSDIKAVGANQLVIDFEQASMVELTGGVQEFYKGPRTIDSPNTKQIQQVKFASDFEARMTWVAGLRSKAGFEVSTLSTPTRIVIDVTG